MTDTEYADIAARFQRETANHEMTVLHDDGVYRHLRFMKPQSSIYWFEIITVPGSLTFRGDGESYVFARMADMFAFFRQSAEANINPGYWSEKITSDSDGIKRYQDHLFLRVLQEQADFMVEQQVVKPEHAPRFRAEVQDEIVESGDYYSMDSAFRTVENFEFYYDPSHELDYDHRADIRFKDVSEWITASKDFDWWFLWACTAIVHAIRVYDQHKAAAPQPASAA